jgi:hypothetical protein
MNQENTNSKNEKDPVDQHGAFSMIGADNYDAVRLGSLYLNSIYALLMPLWIKGQQSLWQEENSYKERSPRVDAQKTRKVFASCQTAYP